MQTASNAGFVPCQVYNKQKALNCLFWQLKTSSQVKTLFCSLWFSRRRHIWAHACHVKLGGSHMHIQTSPTTRPTPKNWYYNTMENGSFNATGQ
ncbi:hypothetical protein L9F63_020240, partial [Diploptera punctata]